MSVLALLAVGASLSAPVPKELKADTPFAGRFDGEREKRLKQFGGDAKTEAAVTAGLTWLAKQQEKDGGWTFDATGKEDRAAATGMVLMAFLGSGQTHKGDGANAKVVQAGLAALQKMQKKDGDFRSAGTMYAHAIATTALCEAYGMTADPNLRASAQKALDYTVKAQGANGSWGYKAATNGDTSIVGWQAQAIRAGKAAGLKVPDGVLTAAAKFLDSTHDAEKGTFGYVSKTGTPSLTAVGVSARMVFDGWNGETAAVGRGTAYVGKAGPGPGLNLYLLYYAGLTMPLAEAGVWEKWNVAVSKRLLEGQETVGADAGSWKPDTGYIGGQCGRVGSTAMAVLTLECYYRYPFPRKAAKGR